MNDVTLVVTSCGRIDLLEQTLYTFFKFNTYPITNTIIIEDSGKPQDFSRIKSLVVGNLEIIENPTNLGQMKSIDIAYSRVGTDFIFHCEDDWEFYDSGFIEKSFEILNTDPKIFTVWLRHYQEKKIKHMIDKHPTKLSNGEFFYNILQSEGKPWQSGFTLNPGLRRTSDCMLLHPYEKLEVFYIKNGLSIIGETDLSVHYRYAGFRAAITNNKTGYIRHIGNKRHVPLPWDEK